MAIMNHMRSNMPVILWGLIFSFLLLIVFEWGMGAYGGGIFGGPGDLGSVNGEKVDRELYQQTITNYTTNYRQQNNNQEPDAATLNAIEDRAWDDLVNVMLTRQALAKLGLSITSEEIYEWVTGDNPPQFLRQYFTDENGRFNREALLDAINNPQNSENWRTLDQPLRLQRQNERYNSLVSSFAVAGPMEVLNKFRGDNTKVEVSYLFYNTNSIADSAVTISDDDIESFYKENKEEFKKKEGRRIRYVTFQILPSTEDSAQILADVQTIARDYEINTNDSLFVSTKSDKPYASGWFSRGDLSETQSVVFEKPVGSVTTVLEADGYHILKVQELRTSENSKYRARHILLRPDGSTKTDSLNTEKKLADLKKQMQADRRPSEEVFMEYARKHSTDGSAQNGGDLGWFGDGAMVKPFEDAVKKARLNTIVGPVKSQFGYHLIYVNGKDDREVRVAEVFREVRPKSKTVRAVQSFASDFAFMAGEEGFEKETQTKNLEFAESPLIESRNPIPGLEYNGQLNSWMFKASVGDISDVIQLGNQLMVAELLEVSPEGYQPLDDELKKSLRVRVLREKKLEIAHEEMKKIHSQVGDDLTKAASLNGQLTVNTTNEFTLNGTPSGVGRDNVFIGTAFSLKEGEISGPIRGDRGAYILKVNKRTEPDMAKLENLQKRLQDQLRNQRKNEITNGWPDALKAKAEIKDNRSEIMGY